MNLNNVHMKEKVCMVTGATSGIGLATARGLARQGATIVAVGRNPEKGSDIVSRIRKATGNPSVDFMQADLSDQAQIRYLAEEFKNRYSRLDVLVNNAGAIFLKRELSLDGIEMTFAVNHLSIFLLTNLLLETLKASAPARIVNVSSNMQKNARISFEDLEGARKYGSFQAYGQSKLCVLFFTYELARRLDGTQVTVNALHPGVVGTNIGGNNGWIGRLFVPLYKLFAKSPSKGAETSIYVASAPDLEGVTGKYFIDKKPVASSPISYDEAAVQRLWRISEGMTRLSPDVNGL
ncbi:MAG: SDR family oxidoreductase [Deltaproteobacteria bacterium]|nr:SDR family oxidoreductase [Deltaproteobacteria bacterium]